MGQPDRDDVILLVEADPVVGLDLADALESAGYRVAGPVRTVAEAETCLADRRPALAVLDLGTKDGARLACTLRQRGVPFLVCAEQTGGADPSVGFMDALTGVPSLAKPAWHRDVVLTMGELAARGGETG